jgi:hypothetical protein
VTAALHMGYSFIIIFLQNQNNYGDNDLKKKDEGMGLANSCFNEFPRLTQAKLLSLI